MENYKHTPPKSYFDVSWTHVKDWWEKELGKDFKSLDPEAKYGILKLYNQTHFPNQNKPAKPIRYLNRKEETKC